MGRKQRKEDEIRLDLEEMNDFGLELSEMACREISAKVASLNPDSSQAERTAWCAAASSLLADLGCRYLCHYEKDSWNTRLNKLCTQIRILAELLNDVGLDGDY